MWKCMMYNLDENGNEVDKLLIEDDVPEKVYANRCDHYGDIRDKFRTLENPIPKPLTRAQIAFQRFCN